MSEKRFMYFEHKGADYILDNPNMELDFIEMLGDCLEAEEIVDRLNEQEEVITNLRLSIEVTGKAYRKSVKDYEEFIEELEKENKQLKKKILEEIDLEVAYVDETYSDGRMSKEQHNGAIISLRQLREKFE